MGSNDYIANEGPEGVSRGEGAARVRPYMDGNGCGRAVRPAGTRGVRGMPGEGTRPTGSEVRVSVGSPATQSPCEGEFEEVAVLRDGRTEGVVEPRPYKDGNGRGRAVRPAGARGVRGMPGEGTRPTGLEVRVSVGRPATQSPCEGEFEEVAVLRDGRVEGVVEPRPCRGKEGGGAWRGEGAASLRPYKVGSGCGRAVRSAGTRGVRGMPGEGTRPTGLEVRVSVGSPAARSLCEGIPEVVALRRDRTVEGVVEPRPYNRKTGRRGRMNFSRNLNAVAGLIP